MGAFPGRTATDPIVVLLDNMEDVVDDLTFQIKDREIADFVRQLVENVDCSVKVIITSRLMPRDFATIAPNAQIYLPLDEGLHMRKTSSVRWTQSGPLASRMVLNPCSRACANTLAVFPGPLRQST